jgi:glycosyltransferase involved in cell wall biosynthesis
MKLSVIIPCFNAARTLSCQLEAFAEQEWDGEWEVIVVDNLSTDDTQRVARKHIGKLPRLRIVEAEAKRGRAYARNFGARVASGEALAFCDADDQVAPGWLAAIGAALKRGDLAASRFDVTKLNPVWLQSVHRNPQETGLQRMRFFPYLFHAGGSGLGVKREWHERLGGFNEALPVLEDAEYCFRAQILGARICYAESAVVHVRYRAGWLTLFNQARLWAVYNVLIYKRYGLCNGHRVPRAWRNYLDDWRRFLWRLRRARDRASFAECVWRAGWQVGLLQGSIAFGSAPVSL